MVSYQWISEGGPLQVTGHLDVTDTASPLQNSGWGPGDYTGRLIDFQIGWLHIQPVDSAYEIGPYIWRYSFDFASNTFTAGGGELATFTLFPGRVEEFKDDYHSPLGDPALLVGFGHWEPVVAIHEPMTLALLILALLLQFLSTRGELRL